MISAERSGLEQPPPSPWVRHWFGYSLALIARTRANHRIL